MTVPDIEADCIAIAMVTGEPIGLLLQLQWRNLQSTTLSILASAEILAFQKANCHLSSTLLAIAKYTDLATSILIDSEPL